MTPRWLLSLSGRKVQTAESRVPRRNPGAPMGMASGDSEATETSNPHGGEYETTLTPMLSGAWVILPANNFRLVRYQDAFPRTED